MHSRRFVIRIMGGLGNQLFQVAHAVNVGSIENVEVALDIGWFSRPTKGAEPRELDIPRELLPFPIASTPRWVWHRRIGAWNDGVRRGMLGPFAGLMHREFRQGYWQDFASAQSARGVIESLIRRVGDSRHVMVPRQAFVAIHIRRGDYASSPATARYHGLTDPQEQLALALALAESRGIEGVRVYSDEPDAVAPLIQGLPHVHVDRGESAWDAMLGMSMARVLVTSNSSLSWWAGVYGGWQQGHQMEVFVPSPWLAEPSDLDRRLLVPNWRSYSRQVFS